jgi:hypothetical protein
LPSTSRRGSIREAAAASPVAAAGITSKRASQNWAGKQDFGTSRHLLAYVDGFRQRRERSAERRMPTIAAMQTSAHFAPLVAFGAAARQFGARSPSGALLRHSPGRTHPPLAQLQFPRFLRPDLTGVTRFDLSRVYRAPRRPVVMPVERWPRAARERMAYPPAGTAPAPLFRHAFRKGALNERGGEACN